jgi:hypothetical protein
VAGAATLCEAYRSSPATGQTRPSIFTVAECEETCNFPCNLRTEPTAYLAPQGIISNLSTEKAISVLQAYAESTPFMIST